MLGPIIAPEAKDEARKLLNRRGEFAASDARQLEMAEADSVDLKRPPGFWRQVREHIEQRERAAARLVRRLLHVD